MRKLPIRIVQNITEFTSIIALPRIWSKYLTQFFFEYSFPNFLQQFRNVFCIPIFRASIAGIFDALNFMVLVIPYYCCKQWFLKTRL